MQRKKRIKVHIGLRTLKTAAAIIIAMSIVDLYGATTSKLIFAMLGAMAAVEPTFKESVEACLSQIVGVMFGALLGILLLMFPVSHLVATGIGVVLVITLYNTLHIRFSPSLSCFVVVMLCTTPDIEPMTYAIGRIWDTAIGLFVGMLINTLVFPYDNSRQIRTTVESLDKELLLFLENMFDGDDKLPDADEMGKKIRMIAQQMEIFSNQRLVLHLRRQKEQLAAFHICEKKANELLARMELLRQMGQPGMLSEENRESLKVCGIWLPESEKTVPAVRDAAMQERDIVMNYHVRQILSVRRELLAALGKEI